MDQVKIQDQVEIWSRPESPLSHFKDLVKAVTASKVVKLVTLDYGSAEVVDEVGGAVKKRFGLPMSGSCTRLSKSKCYVNQNVCTVFSDLQSKRRFLEGQHWDFDQS
jgi:hypothetical protein